MKKSHQQANIIFEESKKGVSVQEIKNLLNISEEEWYRSSSIAYKRTITEARKRRKELEVTPHVIATPLDEIDNCLIINQRLADYALCLPDSATGQDYKDAEGLLNENANIHQLIRLIERTTMHPIWRARQKIGRFNEFPIFSPFIKIIESSLLSYYRQNYIGSVLTLIPVIEGILLRWIGYQGDGKKPDFDKYRTFFDHSHVRQPCPGNPLFHEVFSKACSKILKEHLYKPSEAGNSFSNFNRHLASHLLNDSEFATKENAVRLFVLLDMIAQIYLYEICVFDKRFHLNEDDYRMEAELYFEIIDKHSTRIEPERKLL